jgi:soluble lytic murein transglycosylase
MLSRHREWVRLWSDPVGRALFRLRLRPNHLTVIGLVVSFFAAGGFIAGHVRWAGGLLLLAGLCDLLDGSLARASGQVTAFGAFLDSVIDRYSDIIVLLGIVVLFARMPHARGALVAMAGLVGSVMVSYTKARAESIGVECNVGVMERPERMICLVAGAILDLLEPALWVLAVLANLTAIQRIVFTRRMMTESSALRAALLGWLLLPAVVFASGANTTEPAKAEPAQSERAQTEPAKTGSAKTEPAETEPAQAEPAKTEQTSTESAKTEPAQIESAKTEPAPTEPAQTESPKTEPAKTEPAKIEPAKTEPARTEPSKTEPARAEPARTEPTKAEATKPEQARTERTKAVIAPEAERAWARAIAAHQQGDPGPLAAEVGDAALRSPIGDHLRLIVADALARRGDLAGARAMAAGAAERFPGSRLAPRGLLMAATLAMQAGDDKGAQASLTRLLDAHPDSPQVPAALYLLGQSAEARGRRDDAVHAYRELMVLAPTTGWADGATDRLAVLTAAGVTVPPLTLDRRLDRAERLLRGGVPQTATDEAQRVADEARDPSIVVRALRVVADGAQRLRRYDVAASAIALSIPRVPAERQPALRLEEARLLLRAGRRERALEILARIAASGSEAHAAEALWMRGTTLEDAQRPVEAAAAYRELVKRFPKRELAGAALWRLGWTAYLKGDRREAAAQWSRLAGTASSRAYRLRSLYWHARVTEDLRDRATAAPLYAKVLAEAPRSYYGVLASARVGEAADPAASVGVTLPADPTEAVADDPGFARVDLLRRLGLVESALEELEEVVAQATGDTVRLYGFTSAYLRDERYHLALRIFRRHFAGLAVSGDPALPRAFWEMLYPFGWRPEVMAAARRTGIDPFLVAAVVREESSYYPRAVSRAGARGLMQLMPATARPMAEHRGLAFAGGELLDDPVANLEIGAAFLAGLLREFKDPRLALAAYNAGPARLRQWWQARRSDDVEVFVEQIPFDETQAYVKRVMLSWDEYRRLYHQ